MSARAKAVLAWSLCGVTVLLVGGVVALRIAAPSRAAAGEDVTFILAFMMFAPMGALIAARRPRNPVGWLACGVAFFTVLSIFLNDYATTALKTAPGSLALGDEVAWAASWTWPLGFACFAFLFLLFPNGRLPSRRWRWVVVALCVSLLAIISILVPLWSQRGSALALEEVRINDVLEVILQAMVSVLFASVLLGLVSILFRFRRSTGVERQQLKWMAYVASIATVLVFFEIFVIDPIGLADSRIAEVFEQFVNLTVAGFPVAAAVAILRYRLYDIDRVINKTLVYSVVTVALALGYAGLVLVTQTLLPQLARNSAPAVAASTLAMVAMFRPLRARVQSFVDRRFYRRRYDAARTVESFGARLRQETDLDSLRRELLSLIISTMQPTHVSLWLRTLKDRG